MVLVERYIFRTATFAFLVCLVALTGVIWITQALRELDLVTGKGQTLLIFLYVTMLGLPALIMIVAPIALFAAIVYTLNKLNSDSELIVMNAAGIAPLRILRPLAVLTLLVSLATAFITIHAMPESFRALRDLVTKIRADVVTKIVQEGKFVTLDQGIVFHYRERTPAGELRGIMIQDRRDPAVVSTYLADRGVITEVDAVPYFVLEQGSVQRQDKAGRENAIVAFDRYAIDLDQFNGDDGKVVYKPREWTTWELLTLDEKDEFVRLLRGRFRAELHERFVNPLYPLATLAIAFAALGQARTTRQGRGSALFMAILAVVALRVAGFAASSMTGRTALGLIFLYGVPFAAIAASVVVSVIGTRLRFRRPGWKRPSASPAAMAGAT